MKKLSAILFVFIMACAAIGLAACSSESDWIEVVFSTHTAKIKVVYSDQAISYTFKVDAITKLKYREESDGSLHIKLEDLKGVIISTARFSAPYIMTILGVYDS